MADIDERVSSENIGYISSQSNCKNEFGRVKYYSSEELIKVIKKDLEQKIEDARKTEQKMRGSFSYEGNGGYGDSFKDRVKKLENLKRELSNLFKDGIPEGFEISPVLVNPRLSQKQLEYTSKEYFDDVRSDFIKEVALREEEDLKEQGVSKYVISLMKKGHILYSAFPYNIDHILERANSEAFSQEKAIDPNNYRSQKSVLKVNHFNNLIMLPEKVHEFKNILKRIQLDIYEGEDNPRYFLMLAPKVDENGVRHYLSTPQSKGSKLYSRNHSDAEVIRETIKFLDTKTDKEIANNEVCLQALENVKEEMEKNIKAAKENSDTRIANVVALESFFQNEHLHSVIAKMMSTNHTMLEGYKQTIKEAKSILYPPKTALKSSFTANSNKDDKKPAVPKKKVVVIKKKPAPSN